MRVIVGESACFVSLSDQRYHCLINISVKSEYVTCSSHRNPQVNPASSNTPQPHPSHNSNGNGPYPQGAATAAVPPPAPTPAPSVQVFYMPQAPAASALPMIPPAMNPPAYDLETNVTPAYNVDMKPPAYDANLPAAVEKRPLSVAVPAPVGGPSTEDQAVTTPIAGVDDSLTASASSSPPPATALAKP